VYRSDTLITMTLTAMDDYYNGEPIERVAPDPWDLSTGATAYGGDDYEYGLHNEHRRSVRRTENYVYWNPED